MVEDGKIRHIVSGGLKHGQYYRTYVTQVNQSGYESPYSDFSLIRVGDVEPPPVPSISLDTSTYPTGCHLIDTTCDVYFKWTTPECDDLDHFNIYVWRNRPAWYKDGTSIYDKDSGAGADLTFMNAPSTNSNSVGGQKSGDIIYIGVQAVDKSHNRSGIAILRVKVQDNSFLSKPTEPIYASPHGIWSIRVWTRCPHYENIKAVEIFRDGQDSIAKLLFIEGTTVEFIDILGVMNGLTHYYTYRYITYDGRTTPMSNPSKGVTAEVIDLRYINKAKLEAFNDAWSKDGIKEIETLSKKMEEELAKTRSLATELEKAKKDYKEIYNNYTRKVNSFQQLSAKVTQDENTISALRTSIEQNAKAITLKANRTEINEATNQINKVIENTFTVNDENIKSMATQIQIIDNKATADGGEITRTKQALQTQITQNANAIKLRASKSDIDNATNQAKQQLVSQISVQADRITTVVSAQNKATSQITQLNNAIQLCATQDSVMAAVSLAVQNGLSVACITANRVVVTGEMLFQGNARLVGRLSANYLSIVDQNGHLIWGSDTGVIKPYIAEGQAYGSYSCSGSRNTWIELGGSRVPLTPQPPVNFNGQSLVKITCRFYIEIEMENNADIHNAGYGWLGEIKIEKIGANINATTAGAPLCKLNGYGANTLQQQGNRIDYFAISGGWQRVSAGVYRTPSAGTISIQYDGSATIGSLCHYAIFGRLYNPWNGLAIKRITVVNPYWKAECT